MIDGLARLLSRGLASYVSRRIWWHFATGRVSVIPTGFILQSVSGGVVVYFHTRSTEVEYDEGGPFGQADYRF
ncbi:hypothetical protein AB0B54_20245 [Microbispora bryophytorum]|uniref:hypothetical protein n=1 Tax=Microbispora bryophytorum TaxID=1460882 RepID=UPI0033E16A6C